MFYSQLLLSKKGALGVVWMAAHCYKRLKKHHFQHTNISSSVDKILDDEVHVVTHRILAFLLLGVVRIYSKKVEYLFDDCNEVLEKLCGFKTGKSVRVGTGVSRTHYHSIALPKRFELDAFDLELVEDHDLMHGNERPHQQEPQDIHADRRQKERSTSDVLSKENTLFREAYATAKTPRKDMFSPHQTDQDFFVSQASNVDISLAGLELLRGKGFSLEDRMDPFVLDAAEEEQMHNNKQSNENMKRTKVQELSEEEQMLNNKPSNQNMRTDFQELTGDVESDSVASLSNNRNHSIPSVEMLRGAVVSSEDHLHPMGFDEAEKEQQHDVAAPNDNVSSKSLGSIQDVESNPVIDSTPQGSDLVASLGALHKRGFFSECSPHLKISDEGEKGKGHDHEHGVKEDYVKKHVRTRLDFEEDEAGDATVSFDKLPVGAKKMKRLEVITSESVVCQRPGEFLMSIVTPESRPSATAGTPEGVAVRTPAAKERSKIIKRRKTLFDSTTVVSNMEFKNWIEDTSDLKRERKEVPHTILHAWRARILGHAPETLFEPLTPGISTDVGYVKSSTTPIKSVESPVVQEDDIRSPVAYEQIPDAISPGAERSREQTPIAPGTPLTQLNALRSYEGATVADSDTVEPTTSLESIQLENEFHQEANSFEGESLEKDTCSAKTRIAGRYLHRKFLERKRRKEEQVLNLTQLLAGKTKKESAGLFYEILALKSRDCIEVQQEKAYDDILLRETSKLKQVIGNRI